MRKIIYRDSKNIQRETQVFEVVDYISQFTGGTFKPVITNANGVIDATLISSAPASLLQITRIASVQIHAGDCVRAVDSDHVTPATFDGVLADANVIGVAIADAGPGSQVTVLVVGVLTLPIFSIFNANDLLYLDHLGGLTNLRQTTGYLVPVAKCFGSNSILVQPGYPARLGS